MLLALRILGIEGRNVISGAHLGTVITKKNVNFGKSACQDNSATNCKREARLHGDLTRRGEAIISTATCPKAFGAAGLVRSFILDARLTLERTGR